MTTSICVSPFVAYVLILVISGILVVDGYRSEICHYNGQEYYPGLTDIEPCVTCHCDGDTGDFTCSYKECPVETDLTCTVYGTRSGHCCAECLQHGCFHNGKGYPLGARIPAGPCSYCYCPWKITDDGQPVCHQITCEEVDCPGALTPPGRCCSVCPGGHDSRTSPGLSP